MIPHRTWVGTNHSLRIIPVVSVRWGKRWVVNLYRPRGGGEVVNVCGCNSASKARDDAGNLKDAGLHPQSFPRKVGW
jgi:hypothetical protein